MQLPRSPGEGLSAHGVAVVGICGLLRLATQNCESMPRLVRDTVNPGFFVPVVM